MGVTCKMSESTKESNKCQVFYAMDEPDATKPAHELLMAIAKEEHEKLNGPGMSITHSPTFEQLALLSKCGGGENIPVGMYLWRNDRLIALFTVVRDSKNWSVCVFSDIRDGKE